VKKESLTKKENWLIKQKKGETSHKTHNCDKFYIQMFMWVQYNARVGKKYCSLAWSNMVYVMVLRSNLGTMLLHTTSVDQLFVSSSYVPMHGLQQFIFICVQLKFNSIWIHINIMDTKRYMLICSFISMLGCSQAWKTQKYFQNIIPFVFWIVKCLLNICNNK
jgi:hypothetical protein